MVSITDLKDVQTLFPNAQVSYVSPSTTGSLHYLNIRVTERLHRYRLLKRQWNDLQPTNSNSNISDNTSLIQDPKEYVIPLARTIIGKESKKKSSIKLEPLRSQIQQDLLQLRKTIRTKQNKLPDNMCAKIRTKNRSIQEKTISNTPLDNDDNYLNITMQQKTPVSNRRQVPNPRVHSAIFPQNNLTDSGIITINNPSSSYLFHINRSQKLKQEINSKAFNICGYRVNPSSLSDTPSQSKSSLNIHSKISPNLHSKQTHSLRSSPTKDKQSTSNKPESVSSSSYSSSDAEETTTCHYTYAGSTSSSIPSAMQLNRATSLLPILLTSSSCLGTKNKDDRYLTKDVSIRSLKPIISLHSQYTHDGYGMLFSQLDRLRVTMPNTNVYNNYTRIC
ncbi:hypothetical protein I4U23_023675 [Adineta vaga]|nr:hypothetical protein I4U23_023675 [Adineta vaga]